MDKLKNEIEKYGLSIDDYEKCLKDAYDKVNGIKDMDWSEIIHKYNLDIHRDTLRKATQTIFGGAFVYEYYQNKKVLSYDDDEYLNEIKEQRRELEKEKIKCRDERNEYRRLIREQSRKESFVELVKRAMSYEVDKFDYIPSPIIDSEQDMVVCLSDIHTGINVDNFINKYNIDELAVRLKKYLNEIISIQGQHKCKECYVVLGGDLISGIIHKNLRLQNNEDTVQQIKIVSTYIGDFINELKFHFEKIKVYSVAGNHSRLSANKEEHLKGEELDSLIPFYLELKFENVDNVDIYSDNIDSTLMTFTTRGGKLFYGVHGDKDTPSNVVRNLTLMTGVKPDGIIMGHRHHNALDTEHNVKVVQCGCMVGTDDYCIDHRISGSPEQVVFITTDRQAIKCLYDINLN